MIAWNLTATFHIYNVKPTFDDASSLSYCHPSPYYLAFVLVILFDVLIAIVLFIWVSALLVGQYILVAVGSSGILKAKQKLGVTFNFNKQDIIDFTKFSKMTMCKFIKVVIDSLFFG